MSPEENNLLTAYRNLPVTDQYALLSYAEFLSQRATIVAPVAEHAPVPQPVYVPGAEDETVVAAIKRLRASYPMLSRRGMLDKVAMLMSDHMIHGRERKEVIVALEAVFDEQYQLWSNTESRDT